MSSIRVIDGKILVVGGSICINDDCCCGETICELDTGNDLDVYFEGITNSEGEGCSQFCESTFNGKTFQLTWDAGNNWWSYVSGDIAITAQCISGSYIRVVAVYDQFFCFYALTTPVDLPQEVNNEDVYNGSCDPITGTATVSIHV